MPLPPMFQYPGAEPPRWFVRLVAALFALILVEMVLAECADDADAAPLPAAARIERPADATPAAAERSTLNPVAYVNSLPYDYADGIGAAREAYRTVARVRGWDPATIARWEPFLVEDVMHGESGWCWNVRGGATMHGDGCLIDEQGTHVDAGFFQLVAVWYKVPDGVLCQSESICGVQAVIGSPWQSMNAGLAAVEHDGSRPWCYNADARSYHPLCSTVPRRWPE